MTDFLSFYTLPSTIMNHPTHKSLKAAYSFYNVHTKTPLIDLMSDALILAKSVREPGVGCTRPAPGQLPGAQQEIHWAPLNLWEGLVPIEIQIQRDLPPRRGMQGYLEPSSL